MTAQSNNKNIEEWVELLIKENPFLINKIEAISLLKEVSPKELLTEVVKFLSLVSVFNVTLTPSLLVDLGWHEFILFTKAYEKFCLDKFDRFIHHTPDDNKVRSHSNYFKTINHYINHFGEPPASIWGDVSKTEWEESQCGSCSSS